MLCSIIIMNLVIIELVIGRSRVVLFKMNISSVLYIIVLVVCSLSGIQGQQSRPIPPEGGKSL